MDGLREDISSQIKAWTEKEKKWEEDRADNKKRHVEALESLQMGRERERESWRRQVEDLEEGKKRAKEAFGAKLKNIHERIKDERERWEKEREIWREEKEAEAVEKKEIARKEEELKRKRDEEKKSWGEANDRAQRRIADLEEENRKLKDEATERQKKDAEAEAARKAAEAEKEEEKRRSLEEAQREERKAVAKLEKEVLDGRKLIEDLQGDIDKRRDRQMLLELRAQLTRSSHAAPPSHINQLRFGGSASRFIGQPANTDPSTFSYTGPLAFPSSDPSSSDFAPLAATAETPLSSPKPIVRILSSAFAPPVVEPPPASPKPIIRLPSRRLPTSFPLLGATSSPPPSAPKGPKGGPSRPFR